MESIREQLVSAASIAVKEPNAFLTITKTNVSSFLISNDIGSLSNNIRSKQPSNPFSDR